MNSERSVDGIPASREPRVIDHPFLRKLRACMQLSSDDELALMAAFGDVRDLRKDTHIIRKGDCTHFSHVMLGGWAARYDILADGARAITGFLLPGDLCDQHVNLGTMDHSVVTLTPATVAYLSKTQLEAIVRTRPAIVQAFWRSAVANEAILRAWLVNIGRRDAFEAIGHLLCELHLRLRSAGSIQESAFHLPLTQGQIADALGLTSVHVNRTLQRLRREGYIQLNARKLVINDVARLERATGFDWSYLQQVPVDRMID